eukprot:2225460-Rhodomonas_salina.3
MLGTDANELVGTHAKERGRTAERKRREERGRGRGRGKGREREGNLSLSRARALARIHTHTHTHTHTHRAWKRQRANEQAARGERYLGPEGVGAGEVLDLLAAHELGVALLAHVPLCLPPPHLTQPSPCQCAPRQAELALRCEFAVPHRTGLTLHVSLRGSASN